MAEIDKTKLAKDVGHHEDGELLQKEVSIIKDKKQFSIRIPSKFAKLAKIRSGDLFEISLVPLEDKKGEFIGEFTLEADLKKVKND